MTKARQLTKEAFDQLTREGKITYPYIFSFGAGYGEPHIPDRQAWGSLDGETVWAWVRGGKPEEGDTR